MNDLETYLPVTSVVRNTSFMLYPLLGRPTVFFHVQWQRFSWLKKSSKLILLMILSGPELYRKLEFQFRVLTFPLSCLRKTQISLQIFESPLSRHAECYCPIFEPSILIFEVRGARAVRSGYKQMSQLPHPKEIPKRKEAEVNGGQL